MDDNDNIIDVSHFELNTKPRNKILHLLCQWNLLIILIFFFQFQKMNFSPFTTQFAGLPANSSLHQFTTAKFAQNISTSNGQVISMARQ